MAQHAEMLNQGRFALQQSRAMGEFYYPPRSRSHTDKDALDWVDASGRGTVYAVTVVARKVERGGSYNIAVVELEEGPRMMTRVVGIAPELVEIGMAVTAVVAVPDFGSFKDGDQSVVLFEPAKRAD
nr:OB-fold domain-containing protein [Pseudohalocynthiibacter aestuariivivens]